MTGLNHTALAFVATLSYALLVAGCGAPDPGEDERGAHAAEVADLVLIGGRVVTLDTDIDEVEALAISDDRILAIGSNDEIRALVGERTEVVELNGRLAIPGFIEGHGHFMGLGEARLTLDLSRTTSWDEIVSMVADAAADMPDGAWITGRGWHQERWDPPPEEAFDGVPSHHVLSESSPDNPVLLTHASGHASFANALALEAAGIDAGSEDPPGGTIVRDAEGEPTGFLRQAAQLPAREALARHRETLSADERRERALQQVSLAAEEALAHGVTSFHDAGSDFATIDLLREVAEAGELPLRLYVAVRGESMDSMRARLADYRLVDHADHHLTVRAIKRAIDGALGTHGAWLLEPYADKPETSGLPQTAPEDLRALAELALENDYQLMTHAIGDRGNRETLDIYEALLDANGGTIPDHRWRIEHAQHLHPDDIPRFAELGVIASMQGIHATSDGPWVEPRLGETRTAEGAYVWRSLIESGAVICNGTDVPVEPISPLESFHASVTRQTREGWRFHPEQAMDRMEALRSYTIDCAYAAFQDGHLGSLTPGKLADVVVLERDILEIDEDLIPDTRVDLTIVGGRIRHQR